MTHRATKTELALDVLLAVSIAAGFIALFFHEFNLWSYP